MDSTAGSSRTASSGSTGGGSDTPSSAGGSDGTGSADGCGCRRRAMHGQWRLELLDFVGCFAIRLCDSASRCTTGARRRTSSWGDMSNTAANMPSRTSGSFVWAARRTGATSPMMMTPALTARIHDRAASRMTLARGRFPAYSLRYWTCSPEKRMGIGRLSSLPILGRAMRLRIAKPLISFL